MTSFDYVEIPSCATPLQSTASNDEIRPLPKVETHLPHPDLYPTNSPISPTTAPNPTSLKVAFNLPQSLLSSALHLPANAPATPRGTGKGNPPLLSTRDPLSIQIMSVNFKRFVSKSGSVFWLQDRIEEIVMWRKGWKHTAAFMAAYAFICYFPKLLLLVPHVIILVIMISTHPSVLNAPVDVVQEESVGIPPPPPDQPGEGSIDWLANVQAIQNIIGAFSDVHDFGLPIVPYITNASPYSPIILTFTLVSFLLLIPALPFIPLRVVFLTAGLLPFFFTHPFTLHTIIPLLVSISAPFVKSIRMRIGRFVDNDRLEDRHWRTEIKEVELWENERWNAGASAVSGAHGSEDSPAKAPGWSHENLKLGERKAWTRGRDGWSGVSDSANGGVSNLTFSLTPGWMFVETEDWRPDLEAKWAAPCTSDDNGWVYTNDAWQDPHPYPVEEWKTVGMTRRRRWVRRIYYNPTTTS